MKSWLYLGQHPHRPDQHPAASRPFELRASEDKRAMGSGLAQAMAKTPEGHRFVLSAKEDDEGGEGTDCGSYAHRLPALAQRAVDLSFTARYSSVAIPPLEVSVGERG